MSIRDVVDKIAEQEGLETDICICYPVRPGLWQWSVAFLDLKGPRTKKLQEKVFVVPNDEEEARRILTEGVRKTRMMEYLHDG